ncbi:hypothetical protein [Streptomyces sp. NPDC058045]|uniref:hypothetical protein n=1 Tax=Streptomyces sp. NPDC058045 TaxID=3346311 RepID=UPI0036E8BA39
MDAGMDGMWWPAVLLVLVLGLAVALADGLGRGLRGRRGRGPRPGEVWWLDGEPWLVVEVPGRRVRVAPVLAAEGAAPPGAVWLPAGSTGEGRGGPAPADPDRVRAVAARRLRGLVGVVEPEAWERIRERF